MSIGCSDGVEIESRDEKERKRRDRRGQREVNFAKVDKEMLRNIESRSDCEEEMGRNSRPLQS